MVYDDRIMRMAGSVPQRTTRPNMRDVAGPVRQTSTYPHEAAHQGVSTYPHEATHQGVRTGPTRPPGQPISGRHMGYDYNMGPHLNDFRQLTPNMNQFNNLKDSLRNFDEVPFYSNPLDKLRNFDEEKIYNPAMDSGLAPLENDMMFDYYNNQPSWADQLQSEIGGYGDVVPAGGPGMENVRTEGNLWKQAHGNITKKLGLLPGESGKAPQHLIRQEFKRLKDIFYSKKYGTGIMKGITKGTPLGMMMELMPEGFLDNPATEDLIESMDPEPIGWI